MRDEKVQKQAVQLEMLQLLHVCRSHMKICHCHGSSAITSSTELSWDTALCLNMTPLCVGSVYEQGCHSFLARMKFEGKNLHPINLLQNHMN
jgi:hypothetical protein